ncbi:MAG: alpha/beta hydrolase [Acidobacteriota bacterium]
MAKIPRLLAGFLIALAGLAALIFTVAFALVLWSDPQFTTPPDISPQALAAAEISFDQPYPSTERSFRMRDGTILAAQFLAAPAEPAKTTIVYVHGLLGASFLLNRSSGLLREACAAHDAEVVAIDLRGHGASKGNPGDVDYIGQYEDDLADVIRTLRAANPGGRLVLAGHSMGGGIALRYAQLASRKLAPPVDGYLLLAPYLGWSSPTTRQEPPSEAAKSGAQFIKIHLPRIIGLKLLNLAGITAFNGLRTMFFNLPPELPLRSYSYRATEDQAPADYRAALRAVAAPLLLIAGTHDEAFLADQYDRVMRANGHGSVTLVPGATHNGVLNDSRAMAAVKAWVETL